MKGFASGLVGCAGAVSLTLFVLGAVLAYARVVPGLAGLGLCALGMMIGVVSGVAGFVMVARSGMSVSAAFGLLGLPGAAFLIYSVVSARGAPAINDISTDLVYPPPFVHALKLPANEGRDMRYPESFKEVVKEAYPELRSLGLTDAVDAVFARAMDLAREEGWEVTSSEITQKDSVIEGYATTHVFGFVDDFVIRITKAEGGGCVVDMRSKSRDGKGDLGANAARISEFFSKLKP